MLQPKAMLISVIPAATAGWFIMPVGIVLLSVIRMCVLKETMLMSVVSAATRGYAD